MTERIRWTDEPRTFVGYVGEIEPYLFQIWGSSDGSRWMLLSSLPGAPTGSESADPDELKATAERWLSGFISSLGASFPVKIRNRDMRVEFSDEDEALEVRWAAGRRVRFAHPDAGYPGEAEEAARTLTPGEVCTIGWADIGQSRTDLNLYRDGKPLGHFNSVLFEPVPAEPPKEGQ